MARNNHQRIDRIIVCADETNLVDHAGVLAFMQWCEQRGVLRLMAQRLPLSGTNGYTAEDMIKTLWAAVLLNNGRTVFSTIDDLRHNAGVAAMLGMQQLPSSSAVADWLRRLAGVELRHQHGTPRRTGVAGGLDGAQNLFCELTAECLRALRPQLSGTLDFDASVIPEQKRYAQWTYEKQRGSMGYFAFMDGICVMAEVEPGNHSPNDHIRARVAACLDVCAKAGVPARALRSDAAGYVAALFDECQRRAVRFYVRAAQDAAVTASVRAIAAREWTHTSVRTAHDGARSAELAETAHAMNTGASGFRLVVERRVEVEEPAADDGLLLAVPRRITRYWSIATNDDRMSCAEVVALYNRRQGASEQGNDRLKNDVSIGALPCRGAHGLEPNRVYGYLCALLHNMFEWYKHDCLPHEDQPLRLPTIVRRDMLLAARVTRHARTLTLHLADYAADAARRLQQQLTHIRRALTRISIPPVAPAYAPLIYRRI